MPRCANEEQLRSEIGIRLYRSSDQQAVVSLFVRVNQELAPPHLKDAFEAYIGLSIKAEIGRIPEYYAERSGCFWVAEDKNACALVGMYGLERVTKSAVELRRMYVDPAYRRRGIARLLLGHAERKCQAAGYSKMVLSTSELQDAAIKLYEMTGFQLVRKEIAEQPSNKTVGSRLLRYHFEKCIGHREVAFAL